MTSFFLVLHSINVTPYFSRAHLSPTVSPSLCAVHLSCPPLGRPLERASFDDMGDIQQWRRKIQPTCARTPALEADDSEDQILLTTPKRGLKSKVSSYFDFGHAAKSSFHEEATSSQLPAWPFDQLYLNPKAEEEIDSVMCVLMSDPYAQLDVHFNASLMRIFENYLELRKENDELQKRLDEERAGSQAIISRFNMTEKDWEDEKQDYRVEVKRLEVLLSKASKRGLAEVTLARQDSKIRSRKSYGDQKETIFEFLEKTKRRDDKFYNSQRGKSLSYPSILPSADTRQPR